MAQDGKVQFVDIASDSWGDRDRVRNLSLACAAPFSIGLGQVSSLGLDPSCRGLCRTTDSSALRYYHIWQIGSRDHK